MQSLFSILLIFVLIWFVILTINAFKRRRIKRAGITALTPGCANCQYQLGGWSSSTCPECGSDANVVGVRTGSDGPKTLIAFGVIAAAILIVAPLTARACEWIFANRTTTAHARFTSDIDPSFFVTFDTGSTWRRFPPTHSHSTLLAITRFSTSDMNGMWSNGRYFGNAPHNEIILMATQDDESSTLSLEAIENAVRQAHGDTGDEEIIERHIQSVHKLQSHLRSDLRSGSLDVSTFCTNSFGALSNPGSYGGGGGESMSFFGLLIVLCTPIAFAFFAIRIINRQFKPGWRLPELNEWQTAAGIPSKPTTEPPADSPS